MLDPKCQPTLQATLPQLSAKNVALKKKQNPRKSSAFCVLVGSAQHDQYLSAMPKTSETSDAETCFSCNRKITLNGVWFWLRWKQTPPWKPSHHEWKWARKINVGRNIYNISPLPSWRLQAVTLKTFHGFSPGGCDETSGGKPNALVTQAAWDKAVSHPSLPVPPAHRAACERLETGN